jgi:precorrin-6Y C5,15-methyltransferase (decarboxylating)
VIGTDASGVVGLPAAAQDLLRRAVLVAGSRRLLAGLAPWWAAELAAGRLSAALPELVCTDQPEAAWPALAQALADGRPAVVLASGDPLWFGIGRLLVQRFPRQQLRFHPAPSALQLAFARLGRPWQDAHWISLHGRDPEPLAAELQKRPRTAGGGAAETPPGPGGAHRSRRRRGRHSAPAAAGLRPGGGLWLLVV